MRVVTCKAEGLCAGRISILQDLSKITTSHSGPDAARSTRLLLVPYLHIVSVLA